jgi:hypothetical protein
MREGVKPSLQKKDMKEKTILLLFLLISIQSFSKDKILTEYQYSLSGIGFSQQKISFLSPIFYNGFSIVSTKGKVKTTHNGITSFTNEFNVDFNSNEHNNKIYSFGFNLFYNKYYLINLKDYPKAYPNMFIGWGYWFDSDIFVKPDNTNNPLYYNLNNLFCLSFCLEKKFSKVKISYELNVPFAGIYSGSEYSSSLPYFITEKDASFFQAFDFGSFKKNTQMENKLNIDLKINTKKGIRTIRFQYMLSGEKLFLNNNLKHNTFHVFKIGYLFNKIDYEHW